MNGWPAEELTRVGGVEELDIASRRPGGRSTHRITAA